MEMSTVLLVAGREFVIFTRVKFMLNIFGGVRGSAKSSFIRLESSVCVCVCVGTYVNREKYKIIFT